MFFFNLLNYNKKVAEYFRILSQYRRIIFLGSKCGYKNDGKSSDEYVGEEYETTRELPCNTLMREGNGTIRITKEEGLSDPDSPNSMVIPVYDLYECGLDAECNENICTLLDNVQCRLVTNNVWYLDRRGLRHLNSFNYKYLALSFSLTKTGMKKPKKGIVLRIQSISTLY